MELGENLSGYGHLEVFEATSAELLLRTLKLIRIPFKILNMYSDGKKHYAYVSLSRNIGNKIKARIKTKEL